MLLRRLFFLLLILPLGYCSANSRTLRTRLQQDANAPDKSKIVYVKDFDLEVAVARVRNSPPTAGSDAASGSAIVNAPATPSRTAVDATSTGSPNTTSRSPAPAGPADAHVEFTPAERANVLVNAMSDSLVKALEKAGYTVHRLRSGEATPDTGLRIRGVFAEPDEQNRIRRLLVGGESTAPRMMIYVGIDDLARPEQPLYEVAKPANNDGKHGPIISVTSFAPVARFDMDKNPVDDDIRKVSSDIAADLSALLRANPTAASQ